MRGAIPKRCDTVERPGITEVEGIRIHTFDRSVFLSLLRNSIKRVIGHTGAEVRGRRAAPRSDQKYDETHANQHEDLFGESLSCGHFR